MKKLIALLLSFVLLLSGCVQPHSEEAVSKKQEETAQFESLSDPELLNYLEDTVYTGLTDQFQSEDYIIEDINAVYISKEYLDETAYNSQSNIWFGYTLEEVKEQFVDTPYVFALADDGTTTVVPFEDYDDTYDRVIRNVTIGTGVILICATVSVVTGGIGVTSVSVIFAASAKTGAVTALSSGVLGGIMAGVIEARRTGDTEQALKAAVLQGSNDFKWGAITGAVEGGISQAVKLREIPEDSEEIADIVKETKKADKVGKAKKTKKASVFERAREAERRALKKYGGSEQVTYLDGVEVPFGTPGATRPDVVRMVGDHLEAIEVKYYNLESKQSLSSLCAELKRQVADRITNLPEGSTQRIVLDVTDRGFSESTVEHAVDMVREALKEIYPDIPIDIVGV